MKNVHERVLHHPIEAVRPWIERAWTGGDLDIFPRDKIPSWRKNPAGVDAMATLPGSTRLGHGPFSFELVRWDGLVWRVELPDGRAWHGFELESLGADTRITHTLEGRLGLAFRTLIVPIHDWAVESIFDRLEVALATGRVPRHTARPMGLRARAVYEVMGLVRSTRRERREPRGDAAVSPAPAAGKP